MEAGFTTVRNLGLMVKTGGYLLDVALQCAIDAGWHAGPRIYPAGHAVTPYGGHLDPTVFQRLAPGIMPLSVAEGITNGVPDVIACVHYQIRHGAKLIKVSASGGVMSHSTAPGAQQYSDAESGRCRRPAAAARRCAPAVDALRPGRGERFAPQVHHVLHVFGVALQAAHQVV